MTAHRVVYYVSGKTGGKAGRVLDAGPFLTEADARRWARDNGLRGVVVDRVKRPAEGGRP